MISVGDDVLYKISIDNDADGQEDLAHGALDTGAVDRSRQGRHPRRRRDEDLLGPAGDRQETLGVERPQTWGKMIDASRDDLNKAWWATIFPCLFLFLTVLSFNFIGDGLRDALDPKLKRS